MTDRIGTGPEGPDRKGLKVQGPDSVQTDRIQTTPDRVKTDRVQSDKVQDRQGLDTSVVCKAKQNQRRPKLTSEDS